MRTYLPSAEIVSESLTSKWPSTLTRWRSMLGEQVPLVAVRSACWIRPASPNPILEHEAAVVDVARCPRIRGCRRSRCRPRRWASCPYNACRSYGMWSGTFGSSSRSSWFCTRAYAFCGRRYLRSWSFTRLSSLYSYANATLPRPSAKLCRRSARRTGCRRRRLTIGRSGRARRGLRNLSSAGN